MPNALCSATPTLLFDVALTAWRLQLWRRSRLVGTSDRNYTNLSIVRTTFLPKNPKYYHNFLNEDYIRRAKKLAIRSHPNFMARHVLFRYAVQTCLRWKKADVQPKPIRCGGFSHVALWFTFSVRGFRPTLSPIVDNHPCHLMMLNQLKSPNHVSQAFERKPYTVRNRTVVLDTCKHSNNRTHMATGSI